MWIDANQVKNFRGLKPQHLNLEKTDDAKLEEILNEWIEQSQDLIENYINRKYTDENVPPAVKNICIRVTSNMVGLAIQNRDSPIIKVNDWTIQNVPSEIFGEALKEELSPFVVEHSTISDTITFFAITGAPDDG